MTIKKLPHPFLGRLKIKVIKDGVDDYFKQKLKAETKVSSEFLDRFEVVKQEEHIDPETGRKVFSAPKVRMPVARGLIVEAATDAYGKAFEDRYGFLEYKPKPGDIVWFIPNQSYRIDVEDLYHFIADDDIVGYLTKEELEEEKLLKVNTVEE